MDLSFPGLICAPTLFAFLPKGIPNFLIFFLSVDGLISNSQAAPFSPLHPAICHLQRSGNMAGYNQFKLMESPSELSGILVIGMLLLMSTQHLQK